jgi:hypothetical protein
MYFRLVQPQRSVFPDFLKSSSSDSSMMRHNLENMQYMLQSAEAWQEGMLSPRNMYSLYKSRAITREAEHLKRRIEKMTPRACYEAIKEENAHLRDQVTKLEHACRISGASLRLEVDKMRGIIDSIQTSMGCPSSLRSASQHDAPSPAAAAENAFFNADKDDDEEGELRGGAPGSTAVGAYAAEIRQLRAQLAAAGRSAAQAAADGAQLRALAAAAQAAVRAAVPGGAPASPPSPPPDAPLSAEAVAEAVRSLRAFADARGASAGGGGWREAEHLFFATPPLPLRSPRGLRGRTASESPPPPPPVRVTLAGPARRNHPPPSRLCTRESTAAPAPPPGCRACFSESVRLGQACD